MLKRYIIKGNGDVIGHAETKEKAQKIINKYEYECANQDVPCFPKFEIEEETIE